MNKILVVDNKIDDYSDGYIEIKNNKITFLESNSYYIEFNNSNNTSIEFNVKDGVSLFLDILSLDNSFNNKITYNIYDSNVLVNIFYCNRSSQDNINVNLMSDGSRIDYYFSEICKELSDYKINVYHKNKNTISNIYNKSITIGNSICNYEINSYVYKGNINSNLNQDTKIITMGDNNAKICPNMYIDLDDVVSRHASWIGKFDPDKLFYLMSRGLNYSSSIKLLIKGFLINNMDTIDKRKIILNKIEEYWG